MAGFQISGRNGSFDTATVESSEMALREVATLYEQWFKSDESPDEIELMPNGDPTCAMLWGNEDE